MPQTRRKQSPTSRKKLTIVFAILPIVLALNAAAVDVTMIDSKRNVDQYLSSGNQQLRANRGLSSRQKVLNGNDKNGGFENPEDIVDLNDTPFLVVCSWPETTIDRESVGELSLLHTKTKRKTPFTSLPKSKSFFDKQELSPFADPTCQPKRLRMLGSHGMDAFNNNRHGFDSDDSMQSSSSSWEIAVLNHNGYESIEFYLLTFPTLKKENEHGNSTSLPTLSQIGCTKLREGDVHNNMRQR